MTVCALCGHRFFSLSQLESSRRKKFYPWSANAGSIPFLVRGSVRKRLSKGSVAADWKTQKRAKLHCSRLKWQVAGRSSDSGPGQQLVGRAKLGESGGFPRLVLIVCGVLVFRKRRRAAAVAATVLSGTGGSALDLLIFLGRRRRGGRLIL